MTSRKKRPGWKGESLPAVLAVREDAQLLAGHVNTVRNWDDCGLIPMFRVGPVP